jgi:integrase
VRGKRGTGYCKSTAELKLKFDREGRRRSCYSLRHTYICTRLMNGADIYQIAKNCRTSVEMIEKYYAAHLKTPLDASAINVRKPRPFRKGQPTENIADRLARRHVARRDPEANRAA